MDDDAKGASIPPALVSAIHEGTCVAFVGAGFSGAQLPSWASLLGELSKEVNKSVGDIVRATLRGPGVTALDYEAAAQMLRSAMGDAAFVTSLRKRLAVTSLEQRMQHRLDLLRSIPFRAILTTNFDTLLHGEPPSPRAYAAVLRPSGHRWWEKRFWQGDREGPLVVKLHGDLSTDPATDLVVTRQDYRTRLYQSAAYRAFVRSVLTTNTVLYLGFSFTDAYLNELRSEVLSLFDHGDASAAVAYAVVADVDPVRVNYFRRHEGIEILPYDSTLPPEFGGFDAYLEALSVQSNPGRRLRRLLADRRILWLDAHPDNNSFGRTFLEEAAPGDRITSVTSTADAVRALAETRYDLLLTHWGDGRGSDGASVAETILAHLRRHDVRVPVVVFAGDENVAERRQVALGLGASAYLFRWESLFRKIEELFSDAAEVG